MGLGITYPFDKAQATVGNGTMVALQAPSPKVVDAVHARALELGGTDEGAPGDSEGGPDNRHRGADQWLYVVSGTGAAIVDGRRVPLKAGMLLVIEKGERHEVRNTGRTLLKTLNFYYPPAFDADGNPVGPGRKR